jgi:hypothetical protein
MTFSESRAIRDAVRDGIARTVAVLGLATFALIHLLDLPGTMKGTPYVGWLYIGLIVSAILIAGALMRTSDTRVWVAAAGLVTSVIIAYVLSRTTGLPQSSDDIGNWGQTLGLAMLFVGGSFLALTSGVLLSRRASGQVRSCSRRQAGNRERVRSRERDGLRAAV